MNVVQVAWVQGWAKLSIFRGIPFSIFRFPRKIWVRGTNSFCCRAMRIEGNLWSTFTVSSGEAERPINHLTASPYDLCAARANLTADGPTYSKGAPRLRQLENVLHQENVAIWTWIVAHSGGDNCILPVKRDKALNPCFNKKTWKAIWSHRFDLRAGFGKQP